MTAEPLFEPRTPTCPRGLCADVAQQAIEDNIRMLATPFPDPDVAPTEAMLWSARLTSFLHGHGMVAALSALAEVDPVRARLVAEQIAADWDRPPGAALSLAAWGRDLGVLTARGDVIRDGVAHTVEEIMAEAT